MKMDEDETGGIPDSSVKPGTRGEIEEEITDFEGIKVLIFS